MRIVDMGPERRADQATEAVLVAAATVIIVRQACNCEPKMPERQGLIAAPVQARSRAKTPAAICRTAPTSQPSRMMAGQNSRG